MSTKTNGYVYISQLRDWLPDPIAGCMWLTPGPSFTSCFAPVYCGVSDIPGFWGGIPDFTRVDRTQVQWRSQLVAGLVERKYQEAIEDLRSLNEPAEAQFRALQTGFEETAARVLAEHGPEAAERLATEYTNACLAKIDNAYGELLDYLMFKYL